MFVCYRKLKTAKEKTVLYFAAGMRMLHLRWMEEAGIGIAVGYSHPVNLKTTAEITEYILQNELSIEKKFC